MKPPDLAIYIVDDDESVLKSIKRLMLSAGYRGVETFTSAEEFLSRSAPIKPGLLILDLLLPGRGGIDLYKRLKKDGRAMHTVFVSAVEKELDRARAECGDALAFIPKPFERGQLVAAARSASVRPMPTARK